MTIENPVENLLILIGAVLVLTGIVGGGLKIKEVSIPRISGTARVLAMITGMAFIGTSVYLYEADSKDTPTTTGLPDQREIDHCANYEDFDSGIETYRVINVADHDVLNIRECPHFSSTKVGTIPHDGQNVIFLKKRKRVNDFYWYLVKYQENIGWVNSHYLIAESA